MIQTHNIADIVFLDQFFDIVVAAFIIRSVNKEADFFLQKLLSDLRDALHDEIKSLDVGVQSADKAEFHALLREGLFPDPGHLHSVCGDEFSLSETGFFIFAPREQLDGLCPVYIAAEEQDIGRLLLEPLDMLGFVGQRAVRHDDIRDPVFRKLPGDPGILLSVGFVKDHQVRPGKPALQIR